MNKYIKFVISYGLNIIAFLILIYLVILRPTNSLVLLFIAIFLMFIHYSYDFYFKKILVQFSDLIQSVISLQQKEVFISHEDTILSKIQTQFERLVTILQYQNQNLALEKEEISSIVADISHQLKTPIASLKLYSELLNTENLAEEKQNQCKEAIYTISQQLDFLIAQLIQLARLEGNIIQIKPIKQDIKRLIIDVIGNLYGKASEKNIQVRFLNEENSLCYFDWNWTYEAIYNILDNAIKYSPNNADIIVKIISYEMYLCVEIWDEAKVIQESEYPHIFKRFYRGNNAKKTEGVGLGMFLTKKILETENGYIEIKRHSKGNKFRAFLKK